MKKAMRLAPRGPSNTLSLIGYGDLLPSSKCSLIVLVPPRVEIS